MKSTAPYSDFCCSSANVFMIFFSSGMMIESMAGKSASLNGLVYDATPFTFSEDDPAIDYFGNLLRQCSYSDKLNGSYLSLEN